MRGRRKGGVNGLTGIGNKRKQKKYIWKWDINSIRNKGQKSGIQMDVVGKEGNANSSKHTSD